MSEQTAKLIPTQLNIAPRGKTWKNWELVDGTDGFPTRESMEKYLCNPERVRELEECRAINLNTIDLQAETIAQLEAQLAAVQQGVPALNVSQETIDFLKENMEDCDDSARDVAISHDIEKILIAATHPTQQGLDALTDALTDCRRELQSCQSVIHLAGGFDPRYVSDAKAAIKKADAALAAQAKQGGA